MKKILAIGSVTVALLAFVGCQQQAVTPDTTTQKTETSKASIQITEGDTATSKASLEIKPSTEETEGTMETKGGGSEEGNSLEGMMMDGGKMMSVWEGGNATAMMKDMTMTNGTQVMMSGKVMMKDGTTMMMKDGDMMMVDGKMTTKADYMKAEGYTKL